MSFSVSLPLAAGWAIVEAVNVHGQWRRSLCHARSGRVLYCTHILIDHIAVEVPRNRAVGRRRRTNPRSCRWRPIARPCYSGVGASRWCGLTRRMGRCCQMSRSARRSTFMTALAMLYNVCSGICGRRNAGVACVHRPSSSVHLTAHKIGLDFSHILQVTAAMAVVVGGPKTNSEHKCLV